MGKANINITSLIENYFFCDNPSAKKDLKHQIIAQYNRNKIDDITLQSLITKNALDLIDKKKYNSFLFHYLSTSKVSEKDLNIIFDNEEIPFELRFKLLLPLTLKIGSRIIKKIENYIFSSIPLPEEIFLEILKALLHLPISSSINIFKHLYDNSIYFKIKLISLVRINEFDFLQYKNELFKIVTDGLTSDKLALIDILDQLRPGFAPIVLAKLAISSEPSVQVKAELLMNEINSMIQKENQSSSFNKNIREEDLMKIVKDLSSSIEEKTFAVDNIKNIENNLEFIIQLLKHENNPLIVANALKAINGITSDDILEHDLFNLLESPEDRIRSNFIEMLTDNKLFSKKNAEKIFPHRNDDSVRVKMAVLYFTWHFNQSEFFNITSELIRQNDFFVIDGILSIIEKLFFVTKENAFDEIILRILDINNPVIHKKALILYRKLKSMPADNKDTKLFSSQEISELLKRNISEKDAFKKASLLSSIKNNAEIEHLSGLNHFLTDDDERVRANALETILSICGIKKSMISKDIENDPSLRVRLLSLTVALREDFENKFYEISEFLQSGDTKLIKAAIFVLSHFPENPKAKNIIQSYINGNNIDLASFSAYFISHPVITTTNSENRWQNFNFAQKLFINGNMSEIDLAQRYFKLLVMKKDFTLLDQLFFSNSCNKFTKSYILKLIAENGDKSSFEFVKKYLKDYDPRVRANIVEGIMTHESAITDEILYELLEYEKDPRVLNNILMYIYPKNEKLVIIKLNKLKEKLTADEFKDFDFIINSLGLCL